MCNQTREWRAVRIVALLLAVVALCTLAGAASAAASGGAIVDESGTSGATTLAAADGPPPVVGDTPPTDPDDDGVYEDVRGDNDVNILDVQALFNHLGASVVQNNAGAFDFSPSDSANETTIIDVQALFGEMPDDSRTSDKPNFVVQSVSASYHTASQQVLVDFTVENTGNLKGTQDITVTTSADGAGAGQTFGDVSIAPGNTFSQSGVAIDSTGARTASTSTVTASATTVGITVSTANASRTTSVTVPGPNFQIVDFDMPSEVTAGESLTATYVVENKGGMGGTVYVEQYQDGVFTGDYRGHGLGPGDAEQAAFTYATDRSDAPSTTVSVQITSGTSSESNTVAVKTGPQFTNVEVTDGGSNVNCDGTLFGEQCVGMWEHELNVDVSYTLDKPTTDELVIADVRTYSQNTTDRYFDKIGGISHIWQYTDTWRSQSQTDCTIFVDVVYRVESNNGEITDTAQTGADINLC